MNRILTLALMNIYSRFFKDKVRRGSIRAVKTYVQTVGAVRLGLLGLFVLATAAALLVSGILLAIFGLMALAPIEPMAFAITILIIGILLAAISAVTLVMVFSQKRWLEVSKSYELMEAALAPWPDAVPPNPMDVVKGRSATRASEIPDFRDLPLPTPIVP